MELVLYIVCVIFTGFCLFFLLCGLYLFVVYGSQNLIPVAFGLAWKMTLLVLVGLPLAGVGGIILSSWVYYVVVSHYPEFNKTREIIAGIIISILGGVGLIFSALFLAWEILD